MLCAPSHQEKPDPGWTLDHEIQTDKTKRQSQPGSGSDLDIWLCLLVSVLSPYVSRASGQTT